MVPERGLEPPRIAPHAPETCASAISPLGPTMIIPHTNSFHLAYIILRVNTLPIL